MTRVLLTTTFALGLSIGLSLSVIALGLIVARLLGGGA